MRHLLLVCALFAGLVGAAPAAAQPQPQWSRAQAEELLALVESIGSEGLDPVDYRPARLRQAIAAGGAGLDAAAADIFLHLATDLSQGHVRGARRIAWHIPDPAIDPTAQRALMARALGGGGIRSTLDGLLPRHPEYLALRRALAATPSRDAAAVERLRANLERWRWMPHDLGARYLLVNVPAFELQLIDRGETVARHRIVVGKKATPTPQFGTTATGLILNPTWGVPQSIIAESVGRLIRTNPALARQRGYVWSRAASGGLRVTQMPGPGNSLGQMKLVMPNPFTVYIHDTPSKALFDEPVRAFSHGCIRVQDPLGLAALLLQGSAGWGRPEIDQAVAAGRTTRATFAAPLPVYIGYFTAATGASGAVEAHDDIYGRDAAVVAALTDADPDGDLGE